MVRRAPLTICPAALSSQAKMPIIDMHSLALLFAYLTALRHLHHSLQQADG